MITLSKSRLNTFISCPEKYRLRYQMEIKPLKNAPAMVEGSCLHHLVESGLVFGKHIEDVLEIASERFWESAPFEVCGYASEEEYSRAKDDCLREAKQFLQMLDHLAVEEMEAHVEAPLVDPITMEEVPGVMLQGYIDLIDRIDGKRRVIDLKTTGRKPNGGNSAKVSLELSVYSYLLDFPFERKINPRPVAFLNLIRTKKPQVVWDESERSLKAYVELVRTCRTVASAIQSGHFWKNAGTHCGWCDFRPLCHDMTDEAETAFGEQHMELYLSDNWLRVEPEMKALYC